MHAPGPFAYLVFFLWIPISALLFAQYEPRKAAFMVAIGGTMFLPELVAVDPPILPAINKHVLVCLCAFVGLMLTSRRRFQRMRVLRGIQLFFVIMAVGNVGTALTNPESFVFGGKLAWEGGPRYPLVIIQALRPTECIAMTIEDVFKYVIPFSVGQMLVQSREDAVWFLKAFTIAALIHVPLSLFETVMSPQLHRMVYGYHALDFAHNIRGGGFKPVVFNQSGLGLAMFQFVGLACALGLRRLKEPLHPAISAGLAAMMIGFALSVSRNVAVVIYVAVAIPMVLMTAPRTQVRLAWVLAAVFVTFPITRAKDWFPADDIIAYVEARSAERAASLGMRFDNEKMLIEHTLQKPIWGWGGWGRNRRYDPDSGRDISVTDGEWAIHYSVRGGFGVIGWFWLIALPVLWAGRTAKRLASHASRAVIGNAERVVLGTMALTAAVDAVDLLPNSSFTMVPIVFSGALAGYLQYLDAQLSPGQR
ncbi:hypothetical protein [Paraliomyxa miuraensis]|uniref:hypothetical protein n=1 Tax=Paraliomyxa miuraensis TaxID=376150 RepID=UPI002259E94A|nr:hypothetical protein [Paraliomyxa miuraensis]MCX4243506.1 hypothetical protein [Paraliomyxa miuraensis]